MNAGKSARCETLRFTQSHLELELSLAGEISMVPDSEGAAALGIAVFVTSADLASSSWSKETGTLALQLNGSSVERIKYTLDFEDDDGPGPTGLSAASIVIKVDNADARSIINRGALTSPSFLDTVLELSANSMAARGGSGRMYVMSKAAVQCIPYSRAGAQASEAQTQQQQQDGAPVVQRRKPTRLDLGPPLRPSPPSGTHPERAAHEEGGATTHGEVNAQPAPRTSPRRGAPVAGGAKGAAPVRGSTTKEGGVRVPAVKPATAANANAKRNAHDGFAAFETGVKSQFAEDADARIAAGAHHGTLPVALCIALHVRTATIQYRTASML